ncbi:MAG: DUF4167 domain-containing protein [Alphaproteobacteria bacterium]
MRQGSAPKRGRGRSGGGGGRRGYVNAANRSYDSNGPDVKVRGTAAHIYDKYQALARDASSSGDRIAAENYLQHAEHYFRLMAAHAAAQQLQQQQQQPNGQQPGNGQQSRANGQASDHVADGDGEQIAAGGGNNGRRSRQRDEDDTTATADNDTASSEESAAENDEKTEEVTA